MRMIELTDTFTEEVQVVPVGDVAQALRQWIEPDPLAGPGDSAVDELQAALVAEDHETAAELAAQLAVGYDEVRQA